MLVLIVVGMVAVDVEVFVVVDCCVGVNCGWDGGDGSGGWVGGVSNGTRAKICKNTGRAPTRVICATRALLGL